MAAGSDFCTHALDLLAPLGPVTARKMFGGYGIFLDGVMFALIASDTLYIKADSATLDEFAAAGSRPFTYRGKQRPVEMSYWQAPMDAMEDPEALLPWARRGIEAARRGAAAKRPRKRRTEQATEAAGS
ncbi:MAG: TfoX/Sxy family protein [Alphaproteobacteria bacterium]